ncbi:MAG TPA: hypothetical protein VK395_19385 [Gemmataceae bacterium]|nr:hypothetical protein [Gemmataceae bacterium]
MSGKFREKERKAQVPVQAARETLPLDRYYPSYGQALAELDAARAAAGADAQQRQMAQDAAAIDQATKAAAQAALDAAVKAAEQKAAEQLRAARIAWWEGRKPVYAQLSQKLLDAMDLVLKADAERRAFEQECRDVIGDEGTTDPAKRIPGFVLVPTNPLWFAALGPGKYYLKDFRKNMALILGSELASPPTP